MRYVFWFVVLVSIGLVTSLRTNNTHAEPRKSVYQIEALETPTSIGYPPTNIVFQAHDDARPNYAPFAPLKDSMCWTWEHLDGYIGPYMVPSGMQLLVIKFTSDQPSIMMHDVICEGPTSYTPWDRANSMHIREPSYYRWDNIVIYYVGDSWAIVTLTPTPTITLTPTNTSTPNMTYTATSTETATATASSTPTSTSTNTATATETETETSTSTLEPTSTRTSSVTPSRTATPTPSRTVTRSFTLTLTRSKTPTATEALGPNVVVPEGVSTLVQPRDGNVCYGQIVGSQANIIVEFVSDFNSGIEVSGGGCFTSNNYSLSQILRYLESRGIKYSYSSLPKPTLTPSKTSIPTVTIVPYLNIGIQTDRTKYVLLQPGTICWGYKVNEYEYKVVKFIKGSTSPVRLTNGGCHLSKTLTAEDVFNYLRRRFNFPLNGFLDVN